MYRYLFRDCKGLLISNNPCESLKTENLLPNMHVKSKWTHIIIVSIGVEFQEAIIKQSSCLRVQDLFKVFKKMSISIDAHLQSFVSCLHALLCLMKFFKISVFLKSAKMVFHVFSHILCYTE